MSVRAAATSALAGCVSIALAASGCTGCREDHPYVPYTIGAAGSDTAVASAPATPAPSASSTVEAGGGFAGEPAKPAPPGATRWSLDGLDLLAPEGRVFVSAIAFDLDGAQGRGAFAIVRAPEGSDPGELVFYRGEGSSMVVALTVAPPADLPHDAGCVALDRLTGVGKRTVLVELGAQCAGRATSAPDRWFAVVAAPAAPSQAVRLAATIADPPGAPSLSIDADTSDRDGDGLPDVALRVTLEGGGPPFEPGPRLTMTLAWLERRAGLSRDAAATEGSFAALAAGAAARSRTARDAPAVPAWVAQARALWRAACADGGAPRLVGVTGTGAISCGASKPLEDLGLAEARAFVTLGDPLRAALAIDRAERPPAARSAARVTEAQTWLGTVAPVTLARAVRAVAAVPIVGHGREPAWGSLAFEAAGKLLVRTRAGVVRVDPDAGDEAAADGVAAWSSGVTSPDGATRYIETYDPCDGVALRATFATGGGDDMRDVPLPVAPPLGSRCAGSRGAPARALPIAWGPGGLEAIVEGEPLLVSSDLARATVLASFLDSAGVPGAPRSVDGKTLVAATSSGLLERGPSRARLLRAPELDGSYADQRDCVVSVDGTHVACVRAGRAWVGAWDAP